VETEAPTIVPPADEAPVVTVTVLPGELPSTADSPPAADTTPPKDPPGDPEGESAIAEVKPPPAPEPELPPPEPPAPEPAIPSPSNPIEPLGDPPEESGTQTTDDPIQVPPVPPALDDRLQDRAEYRFDGTGVLGGLGEKAGKMGEWQAAINATAPDGITPQMVDDPIAVPYLLDTCLDTPPEVGFLALVMDPAGAIAAGPDMLGSTGYAVLDEKAKALATEYPFPNREAITAYYLEVEVLYDEACP